MIKLTGPEDVEIAIGVDTVTCSAALFLLTSSLSPQTVALHRVNVAIGIGNENNVKSPIVHDLLDTWISRVSCEQLFFQQENFKYLISIFVFKGKPC